MNVPHETIPPFTVKDVVKPVEKRRKYAKPKNFDRTYTGLPIGYRSKRA